MDKQEYTVLARKYRPKNFKQMVGQTHVLKVLINALEANRLHHAYLFTGTRGVGKTTLARIFAKSLNCERSTEITAEPCGVCSACQDIDAGRFIDLLEVDAASRTKVDETRELLDNVQYSPARGRYKVYLIDEVHMLSISSFNALLKTLEEPPPHVKFLLATTDPHKLPATVLSRCLQFNLKRMVPTQISAHLQFILEQEKIDYEFPAFALLAKAADGSMRDALSLLDQAIAFGGGKLMRAEVASMLGTLAHDPCPDLLAALAARDGSALLAHSTHIAEYTPDYSSVLADMLSLLQRIALAQIVPETLDKSSDDYDTVLALSTRLSPEDVQLFYQIALLGRRDLALAPDPRGGFDMVLLRMLAFRPAQEAPAPKAVPPAARAETQTAVAQTPPPAAPPSVALSVPPTESDAGNEWTQLLRALRLSGMAKNLADNCTLKQRDAHSLQLVLAPENASLKTVQVEKRLQDALEKHLGHAIRLSILIAQVDTATPAALQRQVEENRFQNALHDLQNDPVVKEIQDTFNAQLDTKSVRVDDPKNSD
jgi:DNA polymerase III subunit gamma/tau